VKKKHLTQIHLNVSITYEVIDDGLLDEPMIDITEVRCELEREDGKISSVNLLKVIDESQKILLEDEILEHMGEK
jgi:hypothetical protein